MTTINQFRTKEPTICGVCRGRASGLGYAPSHYERVMWVCEDADCHQLAAKVWRMKQKDLDMFEVNSLNDAFNAATGYLWDMKKTDFTTLNDIEIAEFNKRYEQTRQNAMRDRLLSHTAPF